MKRILLSSFVLFLFFSGAAVTTFAAENSNGEIEIRTSESRVVTEKLWFKDIPPKTYKGKTRIDYYKSQGGYIGVYARI